MNLKNLELDQGQLTQAGDLGRNHPAQTHHNAVKKTTQKNPKMKGVNQEINTKDSQSSDDTITERANLSCLCELSLI